MSYIAVQSIIVVLAVLAGAIPWIVAYGQHHGIVATKCQDVGPIDINWNPELDDPNYAEPITCFNCGHQIEFRPATSTHPDESDYYAEIDGEVYCEDCERMALIEHARETQVNFNSFLAQGEN